MKLGNGCKIDLTNFENYFDVGFTVNVHMTKYTAFRSQTGSKASILDKLRFKD